MTAAELIRLLEAYPPDTRVVVRGYEQGVDDVDRVGLRGIFLNVPGEWWDGDHALATEDETADEQAVFLQGRDKETG